jgi:endonuclease/exonuclease/phosphatase family metal-dependent hydrolase
MSDRLYVATLNIRNIADRWEERQSLLFADFSALQPDLIGLQEVVYTLQQDRLIGASGAGVYATHRAWAGRPEYGNSLLVRAPLEATEVERLDLGLTRSALRALVVLPSGTRLVYAVTHLHHVGADEAARLEQAQRLIGWLDDSPAHDALILVGDFNADPEEPAYACFVEAGFRSAMLEANGTEPAVTWPSGIQAPGMDTDGAPECLDYIWVRGSVAVEDARVVFDRPAVDDPTLYPSDHFGLAAHVRVG